MLNLGKNSKPSYMSVLVLVKEITKPNHTTEWIQEWLALITQLDGT
jgi:hypothetical protein